MKHIVLFAAFFLMACSDAGWGEPWDVEEGDAGSVCDAVPSCGEGRGLRKFPNESACGYTIECVADTSFECGNQTCQSLGDYCVEQGIGVDTGPGGPSAFYSCKPLPAACEGLDATCECLLEEEGITGDEGSCSLSESGILSIDVIVG